MKDEQKVIERRMREYVERPAKVEPKGKTWREQSRDDAEPGEVRDLGKLRDDTA